MKHEALVLIATVTSALFEQRELLHANLRKLSAETTKMTAENTLSDEGRNKLAIIMEEESEACSREFKKVTDLVISLQDATLDLERRIEGQCVKRIIDLVILDIYQLKKPLSNELISNLKAARELIKIKP